MMERVRILLVATSNAPIRALAPRLRDPDLELIVCGSAREALDRLGTSLPNLVVLDGSLPRPDVIRLYGRLRASVAGANVPILFTSHDESSVDLARTTAPDFYLGPEATFEEIEQVLFSFLPESLFEEDPILEPVPIERPVPTRGPAARPAPAPSQTPSRTGIGEQLRAGPTTPALAYLGVYAIAEILAAFLDARLGLLIHAGLLLAIFFHGANVPAGSERTFLWTLWLAPLTRIYGLAQPYAGAPPLTWWALTAIPMVVAGVVAMRLAGLSARDSGLIPNLREAPIAVVMVPVGLAFGVLLYLLLEPRTPGRELAFGGAALAALIAIVNPGIVDELVFRGVLQRGTTRVLGTGFSVLYVSLLYATIVPAGLVERSSLTAVALTFVVGLVLSGVTARTGSVLSAVVAHASLAVALVVLAPYLMLNGLGPAAGPATSDTHVPTPKPAIIVASPPGGAPIQPSPSGQSGPAGPPPLPGLSGQPPASGPTQITLAPPLAPPLQAAPSSPVPGQAPGAGPIQSQAVVVRGTGGSGVRMRAQPGNSGPIITVIPEGVPLLVIGADRTVDGLVWRNVRAPNGNEGWIAAQFVTTGQ